VDTSGGSSATASVTLRGFYLNRLIRRLGWAEGLQPDDQEEVGVAPQSIPSLHVAGWGVACNRIDTLLIFVYGFICQSSACPSVKNRSETIG
jgi:hypothetical protein